ncbi:terpene synthase family protein [Streptomyces sp. MAR4 CNX-425]|uniref:terpene synthase family protein n=1 Tax=Streptomyces sp. MAR4 CNX-425 TaxID=3406343 RepID=UPI003B508209
MTLKKNRSRASFDETTPQEVHFPSISCRIPALLHPEAAGLDDHIIAWARHADLIRDGLATAHFHRAGFGRFAAAVYPRADRVELVAEWQLYNWIVDDQLDEGHVARTTAQRLRTAAELCAQLDPDLDAPAPAGPLAAALADLWERTAKPLSHAWRARFAAHYRDFLAFTILPHTEPARIARQSLADFQRRRRLNSGCEMSFDLIEPANSTELPPAVAASDAYRAVRDAANDVISWTNDIYSVRKEIARGDHDHLAAVLRRLNGGGWQDALDEAAARVAARTEDFTAACRDVRAMRPLFGLGPGGWAVVEESLADLGHWIAGSLEWHRWSPRYREVATTRAGVAPAYIEPHLV